jgi:hypothetical protein
LVCFDGEPAIITMQNNDMAGSIPTQFGLVTKLLSLTLSENSFTGTIPTQIGGLTGLSEWYMASNQLTGGLPTQLGMVTEMSSDLELQYNGLTGTVPSEVGQMVNMQETFNLEHNSIGGSLPTQLGHLNAVEISLQTNRLCGVLPAVVSNLDHFQDNPDQLRPGNMMGPTPCPATSALAALYRSTHENGNSWSGSQLNWMEGDPCEAATSQVDSDGVPISRTGGWFNVTCDANADVRKLRLPNHGLVGTLPPEIGGLTALTSSLGLWKNDLRGQLPTQLGLLASLTRGLSLNENDFSGSLPSQLGQLTQLVKG